MSDNMDALTALREAIEFQNDDTECLMGNGAEDYEDDIEECPDPRCRGNGCMVMRVNRWRLALAKATQP